MALAALLVFHAVTHAWADVTLAPLFCDHAVLQRGVPTPIWSTAAPGEAVRVTYLDQQRETVADGDGRWIVRLEPLPAGGTSPLVVRGARNTVSCDDVVTGEVWLCSGQSNMQWTVREAKDAAQEMAAADFP